MFVCNFQIRIKYVFSFECFKQSNLLKRILIGSFSIFIYTNFAFSNFYINILISHTYFFDLKKFFFFLYEHRNNVDLAIRSQVNIYFCLICRVQIIAGQIFVVSRAWTSDCWFVGRNFAHSDNLIQKKKL